MDFESTNCPTCSAAEPTEYLRARDTNLLTPGEFRLVRCRQCGLVYVNPRPSPHDIGRFYTADYWGPPAPDEARQPLPAGVRRTVAELVRSCPGGRVLDVGCGDGRFTAALQRAGLAVTGVEPSEHACRIAREHRGLQVQCGFLEDVDLPNASLDAVTFFDVLEHVHDPVAQLRRVLALLKPGGAVFVKAPNIACLQARLLGKWWYLEVPRHLLHFSPQSLRATLNRAGFDTVRSQAIPAPRFGAAMFEMSVLHWLRAVQFARRGIEVAPTEGQSVGEALEGKVYAGVPSTGKRAFRWAVRNVLYAPIAVENLIGRSPELLAIGRKRRA